MIADLDDLKAIMRIAEDDSQDRLIAQFGLAAEEIVRNWLDRPIYARHQALPAVGDPAYRPTQMHADQAIIVAILQLAARMYWDERTGGGNGIDPSVPPASVRALLAGHRVFASPPPDPLPGVWA